MSNRSWEKISEFLNIWAGYLAYQFFVDHPEFLLAKFEQSKVKPPYGDLLFFLQTELKKLMCLHDLKMVNGKQLKARILNQLPKSESVLNLIQHCFDHMADLIIGKIRHTEIIFPRGKLDRIQEALCNSDFVFNSIPDFLNRFSSMVVDMSQASPLRILEVGAGRGNLALEVHNAMDNCDHRLFEYVFTDISRAFLVRGRRQYYKKNSQINFDFGILDFDLDPVVQGYARHDFDIVVGFDSLHAAKSIFHSIQNLKNLVKPGGVLAVIESTRAPFWFSCIWGVTPGWWLTTKSNLGPLLSEDEWLNHFQLQHFDRQKHFSGHDSVMILGEVH